MKCGKKLHNDLGFYIKCLFLVMLIYICYCFPITGDDWYVYNGGNGYPLSNAFGIMKNTHATLNGRIFGNTLVYYLVNDRFLKALIVGGAIYLIAYLMFSMQQTKTTDRFLVILLLVFSIPKEIFAQVYPWTSGFSNYVPPVVLILIYIFFLGPLFSHKPIRDNFAKILGMFILGVTTQLFVEHMTSYVVLMSLCVTIWYILVQKSVALSIVSYDIGAIVGAVIMFTSQTEQIDAYRRFPTTFSELINIIVGNYPIVVSSTIGNYHYISIAISFLCLYWIYKNKNEKNIIVDRGVKVLLIFLLTVSPIYFIAANSLLLSNWYVGTSMFATAVDIVVSFAYFFAILMSVILYIDNLELKTRIVFLLCSILIINGQLLLVRPIGPRNFYASYIMLLFVLVSLMPNGLGDLHLRSFMKLPLMVIVVSAFVIEAFMFIKVHQIDELRCRLVEKCLEERSREVEIPVLPYSDYLWNPNGEHMTLYYNNEERNLVLKYISYEEWKNR